MKEPELRDAAAFVVVGKDVRTNNADEASPTRSKIAGLWRRMDSEVIPGIQVVLGATVEPPEIVSAYTAYESDHTGQYTVVLGVRVDAPPALPASLTVLHVPAGKYLVFAGSGPQPATTVDTWRRVWEYFSNSPHLARAYTVDFEAHSGSDVEIHIAVQGGARRA
jgi:predicted transcriptional regulator YdeE